MSEKFMLEALNISKQALPHCEPNPPVGCVLVKNGQIVSKGFTQAIGGSHAEVEARAGGIKIEVGLCSEIVAQFLTPYLRKSLQANESFRSEVRTKKR